MFTYQAFGARTYLDVEYSHPGAESLRLDAQIPDGPGPFPAAIIVHGGAWVTGDRRLSVQPLFLPLLNSGVACFSISYRLLNGLDLSSASGVASIAALGQAIDDVRDAVGFVRSHAAKYDVDASRVALIGESAGAQLVSMAALKPGPRENVEAVVAFYSPSDLVKLAETSPRVPPAVRQALLSTPFGQLLIPTLRDLSPVTWVRKDAPPFLLIHGTEDHLVPFDQSVEMCNALQKAGASCEVFPVDGAGHGMRRWSGQTGYKMRMASWLLQQLGKRAGAD